MPSALSDYRTSRWYFSRRAKFIFIPAFILACVNFAALLIIDTYTGGQAINGHVTDGHYFLGSRGRFTEVSRAVWTFSYYHTMSVKFTHLSVFTLAAIFVTAGDMRIERR